MKLIMTAIALFLLLALPAFAESMDHNHDAMEQDAHGSMDHGSMDHDSIKLNNDKQSDGMVDGKMFLVKTDVDGYTVTFHVMDSSESMRQMGPQSLMVKIEKEGAAVAVAKANSKVIHPNGEEESHPMMVMGDWLMAGYDLGHEGNHQLMVLFKTTDDKKHFAAVYYP